MGIRLMIDSGCDMAPEIANEKNVRVLPLKVSFGDDEYLDQVTLKHREFYEKLIETDVFPKTAQIPPFEYDEAFHEAVEAGDTVVCLTISQKLSGCYQSACIAAADYPGNVYVVDTMSVAVGEQILMDYAVRLRDEGADAVTIVKELEEKRDKVVILALLDTLEYLKRGGRISAAVAFAGNLLSVKPVVQAVDGECVLVGKARGSRAANNLLKEIMKKAGGIDFSMPFGVAFSGLDRSLLTKYIEDNRDLWGDHVDSIPTCSIGSAIGSHIGPGAIAVACFHP